MDPSGGNQPIFNEDGSMAVVANGEIYNYPTLLSELSQNHHFETSSDTEAILHLYEEQGSAAVKHLDGMYAFAITDGDRMLAARDPLGIKPLYYGEKDGSLLFASELKALAPSCTSVHEFPPGSLFRSDAGFSTFYAVPDAEPQPNSLEVYLLQVRATLARAVEKRLMSDVPLGAFLSGGLDSSIIAALARQHVDKLHTFAVGVEGSRDLEAARYVSRYLDTIHHEYVLSVEELVRGLPKIIYHLESFDQDLVRSAIPCYFTARLAADDVKVILTGEGADELFAGYSYYKGIPDEEDLSRELSRSVTALHNINLQRVDRMTMAHSIEGRVPFLDLEMVNLAQSIPARLKLSQKGGVEKWILRKACEDLLPKEIVWRDKEQFDEGSGTVDLLQRALIPEATDSEWLAHQARYPRERLRSAEECRYHQIFIEVFEHPAAILRNVARWADRPASSRTCPGEGSPERRSF